MWDLYNPISSESIKRYTGLLKQKLRLLTNNLDMKAWTKAICEVVRSVNHVYRQNESIL